MLKKAIIVILVIVFTSTIYIYIAQKQTNNLVDDQCTVYLDRGECFRKYPNIMLAEIKPVKNPDCFSHVQCRFQSNNTCGWKKDLNYYFCFITSK